MIVNVIIQARMGSSRLPGKVLMDLGGKPVIRHVIERASMAALVDKVIVAIPSRDLEGPLGHYLAAMPVFVAQGPEEDVAARFVAAIDAYPCHGFVRLCADSPWIAPHTIDALAYLFMIGKAPYAHADNGIRGSNVEIVAAGAFKRNYAEFTDEEKEHVTLFYKRGPHAVVDTLADLDALRSCCDD